MNMWTPLNLLSVESWILLASLLILARFYLYRKWQFLQNMNIPHDPPSLLKFGHLKDLFDPKDAFEYENRMKKKYGPIWGSYVMTSPGITIHDPDILRQIFIKEFHAFPVRQKILNKVNGKELSEGLTAVEGNQWKRIRSSLTPTFSTSKLRQMTYIMDRCVGNASDAIKRKIKDNGGVFNSKTIFSRLSLDIVCSAAFSTEVNTQDDTVKEPEIAKRAKELFNGSLFSPVILLCFIFPPIEKVIAFLGISISRRSTLQYFREIAHHLMGQRQSNPHESGKRVDLMQLMVDNEISDKEAKSKKLEKGMTRNEIVGNSMLMILAGYENTGNTMSFLAYNLATHPEVQKKLQQEIDEMLKEHGKFDYDSVNSLKYLEMCVNESLRLYNPVLRNARICYKETTINGLTIPSGMSINVPTFALSHDPEYWDDPMQFKPERMRDMSQIDPMVYQPFGAGPRNCIAMRFALMEVKISLAKLLHEFTLEPAENTPKPPLELSMGLSVRPKIDFDLRAVKREIDC